MRRVTDKQSLYTGRGDGGRTDLLGKQKVSKGGHRIDILGELDEFSASLGMARAMNGDATIKAILLEIQRDVYVLMAQMAATAKKSPGIKQLGGERVTWLESQIDRLSVKSKMPEGFIVPGDSPAGAALDVARTIARRVERRVIRQVDRGRKISGVVLSYLNRVSSLLFALELQELNGQAIKPTLAKTINREKK